MLCYGHTVRGRAISCRRRFEVLLPHLNERQRRLLLATEARLLGHGGVRAVARAAGVSETTVRAGVFELEAGGGAAAGRPGPRGRAAAASGAAALTRAWCRRCWRWWSRTSAATRMSPLRWTTKSLRHLADELTRQGHPVSAPTVGRLLQADGFSLQANAKTLEGDQHPDRDAQFRYINEQVKDHQAAGEPVISVDAKKKEQLGRLPDGRAGVAPEGRAGPGGGPQLLLHRPGCASRRSRTASTTSPRNTGWVNVGVDHDTSGVRGGLDPPLVAGARQPGLPARLPPADHRGRRRLQQLPLPGLEGRTGRPRRRDGADDHRLPLPAGHLQVEQDRAPAVLGTSP